MPRSHGEPATLRVVDDWSIEFDGIPRAAATRLAVSPPPIVSVTAEPCPSLPRFDPTASGWKKGYRLCGVATEETTAKGMLVAETVEVRATPGGPALVRGRDYEFDSDWGTIGSLDGGAILDGQPVVISYRHALSRLDSLVRGADGRLAVKQGVPHVTMPAPPGLAPGEARLGNVWLPGRLDKLTADNLFPILEGAYPEPPRTAPVPAARFLPRTHTKLAAAAPVKILAWGDSVTHAGYLRQPDTERWQEQFAARLRERFAGAAIDLVSRGWDGHTTRCFLAEPPGSVHNYQEQVLAVRPDLVVSEFINDCGFPVEETLARYEGILADLRGIGAEWIILTPHYLLPEWMPLPRQREIDADPRPYVHAIRAFGRRNNVAVADAARRWGRLWRQGIPYMTLMTNAINHPNPQGMRLFADALMELF